MERPKPLFKKRFFWDVNFELMDYDAKASFVIERVFERGDVEEIRQCRRYYGNENGDILTLNIYPTKDLMIPTTANGRC